jgi:hypothetical protein
MGCSLLKSDLCNNLHVIDNPACDCGHPTEDAHHYLSNCPIYDQQRLLLKDKLIKLGIGIKNNLLNTKLLLYGDDTVNIKLQQNMFTILHEYFQNTKRFS